MKKLIKLFKLNSFLNSATLKKHFYLTQHKRTNPLKTIRKFPQETANEYVSTSMCRNNV